MSLRLKGISVMLALFALFTVTGLSSAQKTTVTMVAETRAANYEWQQQMVARFNEMHSDIEIELVGASSDGTVLAKMQTMMAAGLTPDIGYMDPWLLVDWGKQGIIEDLTPYIDSHADVYSDWNPAVFEFFQARGGTYGIPQDLQLGAIFYNVDHYDTMGLPRPTPTWTYDDLRSNARRLTVWDADGVVTRSGFRLPTSRNWAPIVWAFGGDLVDDWADPTQFTGNTPKTAAGIHFLREMMETGAMQSSTGFAQGTATMMQTNTVAMANYHAIDTFEWDVIGMPHGPEAKTAFINAIGWFMFSSSPNKDAAWEVLLFFTDEEAQRSRTELTGNTPPSTQVIRDTWLPGLPRPENRHLLLEEIAFARSPWPLHGDVWNPINQHILAAIRGEQPVEGVLITLENLINTILRESGS